jgi:hypothetical protein
MKTVLAVVISFCLALVLGWFIWGREGVVTKPAAIVQATTPTSPTTPAPQPTPPVSNLPLPSEWQELRSVRNTTLQNNPDLAAEYKSLMSQMDQQQKDLDAAMIKADPKVAPVVTKLAELRKRNSVNRSASASN